MDREQLDRASILPMHIDDGSSIICVSVSGGADYLNGVPRRLCLLLSTPGEDDVLTWYEQDPSTTDNADSGGCDAD